MHLAFDGDGDGRQGGAGDWVMRIGAHGSVQNAGTALTFVNLLPNGYELEVALPVSMLGGDLAHERSLGFNIALEDDDGGQPGPETWLVWEGASAGGVFADLGTLQLQAYQLTLQGARTPSSTCGCRSPTTALIPPWNGVRRAAIPPKAAWSSLI